MWMVNGKPENFIFESNWNLSNSVNFYDYDYYYRCVRLHIPYICMYGSIGA